MLLTSAFSKENSAIYIEEWDLVFKEFTVHPLFAVTNAFNVCIFERELSYLYRGVGLGV